MRSEHPLSRRDWFKRCTGATLGGAALAAGQADAATTRAEQKTLALIRANQPSRLPRLSPSFRSQFGVTHVAGRYHLTDKPFLIEGAEGILSQGSLLGKFWLDTRTVAGDYPYNSTWGQYRSLVELMRENDYQALLDLPFSTFVFECFSEFEEGWNRAPVKSSFYTAVSREFYDLTAHLYGKLRDRKVLVVLQNWEGDWLLRGLGDPWTKPPADWWARCQRILQWFKARQAGVQAARRDHGRGAKCTVAHAVEVNRVLDAWRGIPTLTRNVLPYMTVDLVSYSSWDIFDLDAGQLALWNCLAEIRRNARTGPLFGPGAIAIGEYGIPEYFYPDRISQRYDENIGVMLAANVRYAVHWQHYCNDALPGNSPVPIPITDPSQLIGTWHVRPDGTLSESGRFHRSLWKRAGAP